MNPFRWDVILVGLVLALPVLALGLRGDLSVHDMTARLPWCLAAGWGVVALLRFASAPRTSGHAAHPVPAEAVDPLAADAEQFTDR